MENEKIIQDSAEPKKKPVKKTPVKIADDVNVRVKSTCFGQLIFANKIGESTEWSENGEIQVLTMKDLRDMKAQHIAFFKNQWVLILGTEDENDGITASDIINSLAITKYYENYVDPTNAKDICSWEPKAIRERVNMLSDGAKANLVVSLNKFIKEGKLDSMKRIKAFEEALGCDLAVAE